MNSYLIHIINPNKVRYAISTVSEYNENDYIATGLLLDGIRGLLSGTVTGAALWTAKRIYAGVSLVIPMAPPRDLQRLSMEIVA